MASTVCLNPHSGETETQSAGKGGYTQANQQWRAGSVPVKVDIGLGLVTCKHNWLRKTALLWTVEIANATKVNGLYHLCFSQMCCWSQDAACASAVLLLFVLELLHSEFMFPKPCSAICLQCSSFSPRFCSIIAPTSPAWSYPDHPVWFFFLTATHRKFSSEGGFVKRPLSLCVVSDLFPFCSSCHSSLLLSLSSQMNLICFSLLLDWRHLHSCYSAHSKGDISILLLY